MKACKCLDCKDAEFNGEPIPHDEPWEEWTAGDDADEEAQNFSELLKWFDKLTPEQKRFLRLKETKLVLDRFGCGLACRW